MSDSTGPKGCVVVIGAGGLGSVIADRLGQGRPLILADWSNAALKTVSEKLTGKGYQVETHEVDITDQSAVRQLAQHAASVGHIEAVVLAAGLSASMDTTARIYEVDLVGTANVIEAFVEVVGQGSAVVCIASAAGYMDGLEDTPIEIKRHLATAPISSLLQCPDLIKLDSDDSNRAYYVSKQANIVRVQAAAKEYGKRGARINSISPGLIDSPLITRERASGQDALAQSLIDMLAISRLGRPEEIADAVEFLVSDKSRFISGTDLSVDGGLLSSLKWHAGAGS